MVLLIAFSFLLIAQLPAAWSGGVSGQCILHCLRDNKAVCAHHHTIGYRNFQDRCTLQVEIACTDPDWTFIHNGVCTPYEVDLCRDNYNPVCALSPTEGYKTYDNLCKFNLDNTCNSGDYVYVRDGRCDYEGMLGNCSTMCLAIYEPICAYSSSRNRFKEFSSKCYLELDVKCYNGDYIFYHNGPCTREELGGSCIRSCARIYNPVCAQNANNKYTTFGNPCELGIANNCNLEGYSLMHYGACTPEELNGVCSHVCPLYYVGICGYSFLRGFRTFPNYCFLDKENRCTLSDYRVAHRGICTRDEIGTNCRRNCQLIFSPVCGKSLVKGFRSFPNYCYMDKENGCNCQDYDFVHQGECFPWEICSNCQKGNALAQDTAIIDRR